MTRVNPISALCAGSSRLARLAGVFVIAAAVSGCGALNKAEVDPTIGWSAERLYQEARTEISDANWVDARQRLEALEARYPFGGYAQQALIDLAYVNWKDDEPEQALAAIDRFQQQYPNQPGTDYMLYLKGLITFTPPSALLSEFTGQNPAERDPKGLRESYEAFKELINRYPDSRYTPDAKKRMTWIVSALAENEAIVAQYYYDRAAYLAAINRAQTVITDFEGVPVAEKALYLMYMSYDKLNMPELRDDVKRVLDTNFPNSAYYTEGLKEARGTLWNPINWF